MNILTRFDDKQVTKTYMQNKLRWDIKFTKKPSTQVYIAFVF